MIIRTTKTFLILAFIGLFFACKQAPEEKPDYALVKGKITNAPEGKKFRLYNPETSKNVLIDVHKNGHFQDTLRLKKPTVYNVTYNGIFKMYLSNGMDLKINFDAKEPSKTISFSGQGAAENQYLQFKTKAISDLFEDDYRGFLSLDQETFDQKEQTFKNRLITRLEKNKGQMDSAFIASEKEQTDQLLTSFDSQRKDQLAMNEKVGKGKTSPAFKDYKNYEAGTSSLEDYRGSYVYIDVWATWCVPCIAEIPSLKKIEKQYESKNIKFLSLSVDNPEQEDKWRKMIKDKNLAGNGIQLLADNELKSDFIQAYHIQGIPRFILLDPQGKVISNDAPRPSDPKLKEMFTSLDL